MKPRNCDECRYTKNCNSAFGSLGCKYVIRPSVIALILVLILSIGSVASAMTEDEEIIDEIVEVTKIDAEDIGIKTIEKEGIEDEEIVSDSEPVISDTEIVIPEVESESLDEDWGQATGTTEEDLSEPPEGMYEGFYEGEYYPVNCYDCDIHSECYKCKECTIETTYSYDEYDKYIKEDICIVCGHTTCTPIEED